MRFLLLPLLVSALGSLSAAPVVRVAPYQGDRVAAIVYSLDDGLLDQATLAAPMLEERGFRGTFFVVPGCVPETDAEAAQKKPGSHGGIPWTRLKELADAGHEIANHSWSHANLRELDAAGLREEIDKADALILQKIGRPALTFCYPGNGYNEAVRAAVLQNHIDSRDRNMRGFGGPAFTTATANAWADELVSKGDWGITVIHGIVAGYEPFTSPQVLADHLDYVKAREDQIWVTTFADLARYLKERESAKLTVKEDDNHQLTITVASSLDPAVYNVPLTVVVELQGVISAGATQGGKELPVRVLPKKVMFDCVPGAEPVTLDWRYPALR